MRSSTTATTRIDGGDTKLLTRTGLDWSHRYRRTIGAFGSLKVKSAYIDGELCALGPDGVPEFSRLQAAMDEGRTDQLVFYTFDLLFLGRKSTAALPLIERKKRLHRLFRRKIDGLLFSEHVIGDGPRFRAEACKLGLEGTISKQADQPYAPGDRVVWVSRSASVPTGHFVTTVARIVGNRRTMKLDLSPCSSGLRAWVDEAKSGRGKAVDVTRFR